jgi:pilus assembly protein CpaC
MHLRNAVITLGLLMVFTIPCVAAAQPQAVAGGAVASAPASQVQAPAQAPAAPAAPAPAAPAAAAQAPAAPAPQPSQQTTEESVPLRVMVGKSLLINTTDRLKRVSVTDPNVADAVVVTPHQIMVHGRSPGEVSLVIWDEQERSRSFDLRVDVDVTAAAEEIHRIFPDEQINVSASRSAIVLSGHVSTQEIAERAGKVADAYSKNVVNVLAFGPVGAQEVSLEVKFAEVDRTLITQWGFNLFSTGATNTIGQTSTQQFGSTGPLNLQDNVPIPVKPGTSFASALTFNDLLNMFVFRPDIHLGAVIKALQQQNVLQVLAEPNLIAVNGKEASFLAGGEFPIPVVQGAAGLNSVTILFKEFGVRLSFTPTIMPNGNVHLAVKPEVSTLDFANGLRLQGFVVPALNTRRASTELELKDGQSFVIAGLLDNRLSKDMSKLPGIGDIPILGYFFKSKDFNRSNTELMVLVTVHRVFASDQEPPLPKYPEKFLNPERFDKSSFDKLGGAASR